MMIASRLKARKLKPEGLLEDIPALGFQVVLHRLASQDHGNLRQVNRSIFERTTQQVPHITFRLSDSSNADQLQGWFHATRNLQHVSQLVVRMTSSPAPMVFEQAMQMLAERATVTKLYILADSIYTNGYLDPPTAGHSMCIGSLAPLKHMCAHLQTLVIKVTAALDMPSDLKQLATAGPWQLKSLTLTGRWSSSEKAYWSVVAPVLQDVIRAFPHLQQLQLHVPQLDYSVEFQMSDGSVRVAESPPIVLVAKYAVVTALANSVMQLRCLADLRVSGMPDVWQTTSPGETFSQETAAQMDALLSSHGLLGVLTSTAAAAEAFSTLDHCGCWLLQQHPKLSKLNISTAGGPWGMSWKQPCLGTDIHCSPVCKPSAAAADSVAEQHAVSHLRWWINTCFIQSLPGTGPHNNTGHPTENNQLVPAPGPIAAWKATLHRYSFRSIHLLMLHISSLNLELNQQFVNHQDRVLAMVLGMLKNLRILQIAISCKDQPSSNRKLLAVATVKAAASALQLQTITIKVPAVEPQMVTEEFLLPLTGAAGGPGRSLKKLKLVGSFRVATGACKDINPLSVPTKTSTRPHLGAIGSLEPTHTSRDVDTNSVAQTLTGAADHVMGAVTESTGGCAMVVCQAEQAPQANHLKMSGQQPATDMAAECRWSQALQQMDSLHELNIIQLGRKHLDVAVESLPASLQVLEGCRLNFVSSESAESEGSLAMCKQLASRSNTTDVANQSQCAGNGTPPDLYRLKLQQCQVSSPRRLASQHLKQLIVINSSCRGGWAAAATAWPALSHLTWCYTGELTKINNHKALADLVKPWQDAFIQGNIKSLVLDPVVDRLEETGLELQRTLTDILLSFKSIRSLTLMDLPWLSIHTLQPVVHHMPNLRYLSFGIMYSVCCQRVIGKMMQHSLRNNTSNSGGSGSGISDNDNNTSTLTPVNTADQSAAELRDSCPEHVQQWLQQQLPWLSVSCVVG